MQRAGLPMRFLELLIGSVADSGRFSVHARFPVLWSGACRWLRNRLGFFGHFLFHGPTSPFILPESVSAHIIPLRVRAEVLDKTDVLACVEGTSNVLLLHTDLMGTIGTVSISPGVEQTAYGVFGDLVDVARGWWTSLTGIAHLVESELRRKLTTTLAWAYRALGRAAAPTPKFGRNLALRTIFFAASTRI
jgi:hypothetical protein